MQKLILLGALLLLGACARLDHVQIGDIDQSKGKLTPISISVSETGVEMAVIAGVASELTSSSRRGEQLQQIRNILALINMGPRTGNPVFNDRYASNILYSLHKQCASGKITGIRNIREAKTYGPISGEIVRIDADCIL